MIQILYKLIGRHNIPRDTIHDQWKMFDEKLPLFTQSTDSVFHGHRLVLVRLSQNTGEHREKSPIIFNTQRTQDKANMFPIIFRLEHIIPIDTHFTEE